MKCISFLLFFSVTILSNFFFHAAQCAEFLLSSPRRIAIVGTGYVGLITGAGLAEVGHRVTCADINEEKIQLLNGGGMPIFEPGLELLVSKNISARRLFFTSDVGMAIAEAEIVIIAVGTPMGQEDRADLSALESVAEMVGKNLNGYKIVCIKSTVPVGTNEQIRLLIERYSGEKKDFAMVSNPEFLRAGCAIKDFFERTPVVLGSDSSEALDVMVDVYHPLIANGADLIRTNLVTAELIKYAWNAYSATKITYVNEVANLCGVVGADVTTVVRGISFSEKLLPLGTVRPGPGIGGSCLPKDIRAAIVMAADKSVELNIVKAVVKSNETQKIRAVRLLLDLLGGSVQGKQIAVLGLSFKPNTDDVRGSPAIKILKLLLKQGAHVKCYDPQAMANMKKIITEVFYCQSVEEALENVDAVLLLTDWEEFKNLNLDDVADLVAQPVIVDTRNMWSPVELSRRGFQFANFGRNA